MGRTLRLPASPISPLDSRRGGGWVQRWLGRELESRGIDAVVYTRYVLSLLLRDDVCAADDDTHLYPPPKLLSPHRRRSAPRSKRSLAGRRRATSAGGSASDGGVGNSEQMKKTAAVECLLSVSDEDSGIESLVDELYTKLQEQASEANDACNKSQEVCQNDSKPELQDPAEKYYAAFPALTDKSATMYVATPASAPTTMACDWAKVAQMSSEPLVTPLNDSINKWKPETELSHAIEDKTWYTGLLDDMFVTTLVSRPPLYARHSPVLSPVTIVDPEVWACDGPGTSFIDVLGWPERFEAIPEMVNQEKAEVDVSVKCLDEELEVPSAENVDNHYPEISVNNTINNIEPTAEDDAVFPCINVAADGADVLSLHVDGLPMSESSSHYATTHCAKSVDEIIADWGPELAFDDDVFVSDDDVDNDYKAFCIDSFVSDFDNGIKNRADSFGSEEPDCSATNDVVDDVSFNASSVGCDACGCVKPDRRRRRSDTESPCPLSQIRNAVIPVSTENDVLDHRPFDDAVDQLFGSCDSYNTLVHCDDRGMGGNLFQLPDWLLQPLVTAALHSDDIMGSGHWTTLGGASYVQGIQAGLVTPCTTDTLGWRVGYDEHFEENVKKLTAEDALYTDNTHVCDMDAMLKPSPLWHIMTSPLWGCLTSPPWGQYESSSLLHIQRCLLGVRFELPHQRTGSFIQGGVYGCDTPWSPPLLKSNTLLQQQPSQTKLPTQFSGGAAIGKSSNTAFRSRIPPRLNHLPHVHSAPCLSAGEVDCNGWLGKLVHAQHMYKSDGSIVQQLNRASTPTNTKIDSTSSDRHFKPIRTDEDTTTPVPLDIFSPVHSVKMTPAYQPYGCSGDFVPRFRLQQDEREKFSQTDTIADIWPDTHVPRNTSIWANNIISSPSVTKQEPEWVKGNEEFTAKEESFGTLGLLDADGLFGAARSFGTNGSIGAERSFGAEGSFGAEKLIGSSEVDTTISNLIAFSLGETPFVDLFAEMFRDGTDPLIDNVLPSAFTNECFIHNDAMSSGFTDGDTVSSGFTHGYTVSSGFTFGNTVSSIFTHDDTVSGGFPYSGTVSGGITLGDIVSSGFTHRNTVSRHAFTHGAITTDFLNDSALMFETSGVVCDDKDSDQTVFALDGCDGFTADQGGFTAMLDDCDSTPLHDDVPPLPSPGGHAMYSSELEEQWLRQSVEKVTSCVSRKRNGSTSGSKPCSYFMESQCRRADCKYSHDIGAIPCRFWQEGDCFKGDTCPFLHRLVASPSASPDISPGYTSYKDRLQFGFEDEDVPELQTSQPSDDSLLPQGRRLRAVNGFGHVRSQPIRIKTRRR